MDLLTACTTLAALMQQVKSLSATYDVQIQALEVAKADAIAGVTFEMDSLKALIRPLLLEYGHSLKVEGLTASVVHKQTWDTEMLLAMAVEIPAILQCQKETSYVVFR